MPRSAARAAISMASAGSLVVISTKMLPARLPANVPCRPSTTSRTSAGNPTSVNTTSAASATAFGLSAHFAPAASSGSALARVRLNTVTANPRRNKWPHMLCAHYASADPTETLHTGVRG